MEAGIMTTIMPQPVSPSEIQSKLSKIWESLEGANKIRASLFNLIFFSQKTVRENYLHKIAQKVIEKFPSRLIFVTLDKDPSQDYLKTSVSVMPAQKGEVDVDCDYIQIEVAGTKQSRVPFLLLPHILPDLPVFFVWGEDPLTEIPLCNQLEKFASKLIFDSESTDNLPRFAQAVLQHQERSQAEIADLNWARLESWRDLMTSAFHPEERLKDLQKTKSIKITYNAHATAFFCHTKIQSIYLQSWLATQLNWKFKNVAAEKDALHFIYQREKGEVRITLNSEDQGKLPAGMILHVDLITDDEHHFEFSRNPEYPSQISIIHSTPKSCDRPTHYLFEKAESGHSLVKEISRKGTSLHYVKVLQAITKMEGSLC
jgi:hypothetical protein